MDRKSKKCFIVSMTTCLFFLVLIMGFTIVEKNTYSIISGENLSLISYNYNDYGNKHIKIHFLGKDFVFYFG